MTSPSHLTDPERQQLLDLARTTLNQVVRLQSLPEIRASQLPATLRQTAACFVSLTKHDRLCGCIGHLLPRHPLYQGVIENTRSAALTDPRFSPLQPAELNAVRIEISVLGPLQPLDFASPEELLGFLSARQPGVVLHLGGQLTTFLPQVWSQLPDPAAFLERLAEKAGNDSIAWRQPGVRFSIYAADVFAEPDSSA
jgi:AmmeMemoRadiSam system protein A